jgi:peptide/nickel transport system substrate-binding protein
MNDPIARRLRRLRAAPIALGAAAVSLALVAACSSGGGGAAKETSAGGNNPGGSSAGTSAAQETPKAGGQITMLVTAVSSMLDPAISKLYSFTDGPIMTSVYGTLVYEDPKTGKPQMDLLKSMTSNSDFTVWTMTLNPGIKFSDGTPLNAEAMKFNYERMADPKTASIYLNVVKDLKLKVVDDVTLEVTLPEPNAHFPNVVAEDLGAIGSPTAIKAEGKNYGLHPVGAGPFKLKNLNPGQSAVVVRNPEYASFRKGQPYLDQITFQALPDQDQVAAAMTSGQAQAADPVGGYLNDKLKNAGVPIVINKTGGGGNLLFNMSKPPFNDLTARKAISLALNRKNVANVFATGTPEATNLFAETSPFYDAKFNWPKDDSAQAQKLFDEYAAKHGGPLEFTYETINTGNPAKTGELVLSELSEYKNVKMHLNKVPSSVYISDVRTGKFQIIPHGLYIVAPVPAATDYFASDGPLNTYGWKNPKVDSAIKDILKTSDEAQLKNDWATIQQEMLKDIPIYWADIGELGFAYSSKLTGVHPINYGIMVLWNEIGYKQ